MTNGEMAERLRDIVKYLKHALASDPHYARIVIEDLITDLTPQPPTLEERVEQLEEDRNELARRIASQEGSYNWAQEIFHRGTKDD